MLYCCQEYIDFFRSGGVDIIDVRDIKIEYRKILISKDSAIHGNYIDRFALVYSTQSSPPKFCQKDIITKTEISGKINNSDWLFIPTKIDMFYYSVQETSIRIL